MASNNGSSCKVAEILKDHTSKGKDLFHGAVFLPLCSRQLEEDEQKYSLACTYLKGLSRCRNTALCLKGLVTAAFESSEPFYMGKWMYCTYRLSD